MPRDNEQERRDNLNRGIPKQRGLDEGTKASLQRSLDDSTEGIRVGSFRDLQVGLTDTPLEDRPSQDDSGVVSIAENDEQQGVETQATQEHHHGGGKGK
jgi:hypothetical protein